MEFKGTKGKWEVDGYGVYSLDPLVLDNIVCLQPEPEFDSYKNWKANAQLISKAPEMLEMLKDIVDTLESGETPHIYMINELIKDATTINHAKPNH